MLKHASVLISIALASLYALGLSSHQGFLKRLGIEETQFTLTLDRTFFQGFVSVADMGSKSIGYLFLASMGVVIVALIGIFLNAAITRSGFLKFEPKSSSSSEKRIKEYSFFEFSAKMFQYISLLLFVFIGSLAVLLLSHLSGKKYAENYLERVKSGELSPIEVRQLGVSDVWKGYAIICSDSQCAYLVDQNVKVLNKRDIVSLKTPIEMP